MLKRTLAALIVALTAFCGGTAQAEPLKLTFSTGSVGGGFFAVGSGIAGFASQKIPGISITAISAAGVVESINRLEQGKTDFAMLNTQDPPLAWEGKAPYKKQYRNMRGMGILYMQAAQPYTLKSSGIRTFKDLKGKTLSVGAPGGTMHLDFFRWVEANGLDPKKDFGKVLFLPASEAMEAVKTGQVDVAVELSSIPSPQISELSILRPVHILEFLPGARADMMQKYPQYLPTTIEKGAYNGIDQPIETVGTGAIEAAASTGGQIMPPIMGAVAFLMAEFTQIPYLTIVTVATGPIILYYITLMAFIHFEAKKHNIGQMKDHHIPSARTVCSEGWHFFVAIMVIIVIMAFGYSPGMSALGGIITLIVIHSIKSRKVDFKMLYEAMVLGGRYSLGIGSLVGCIGIILSLVGLTGVGLKLSWLFTTLANGSPLVAILLVGLISMILGMGLASGPAYIVTAIAVGPALADMGFPLMTAHFIMMWFSIDSEITPPVGLASIVGAGIANADPMKTMFTAFKYAKALYILPILFYYRPALLLQSSLFDIALTFVTVMLGLIAFAAVWENYLMRRTTLLERILLLSGALLLFIPGHIWDFAGIGLFIIVYCLQRYYCPAGFRQTA